MPGNITEKARAFYGVYLSALERHDWDAAMIALQESARLAPERYEPFPFQKYIPERIVGAGGFGVVFRCRDVDSGARVAVKALRTDALDRDAATVLAEAEQLENLEHENIIRLRTAGFADIGRTRPYLVMSFFDGATLDEHVQKYGPLSHEDVREIAAQLSAGLQAAHNRGILHRDVKPGNVMGRKVDGHWQVKLIDFSLALRRQAMHHTLSNVRAMQDTLRGKSLAGTLDYAAPEQMGKLKGFAVDKHSDVYGFGRTICFLLFKTPNPGPDEWDLLTDPVLRKLLGGCLKNRPSDRTTIAEIRQSLGVASHAPAAPAPPVVHVEIIPKTQPPASDLPPLSTEILALEGKLDGLRRAIKQINQRDHPQFHSLWKSLAGCVSSSGKPLIECLKRAIEKNPAHSPAQLCAMTPDAPQASVLAIITVLKRMVELKTQYKEVEERLHTKQEEDFRVIVESLCSQSAGKEFPLEAWLRIQPQIIARRYSFIAKESELLPKAEQLYATISHERERERHRLERDRLERQQRAHDERLRREREQEEARIRNANEKKKQAAALFDGLASTVIGAVVLCLLGLWIAAWGAGFPAFIIGIGIIMAVSDGIYYLGI